MKRLPIAVLLLPLAACESTDTSGRVERDSYALTGSAAELYERLLVPPLFAPWARGLVDSVDIEPGDRVLDVACGTGVVAQEAVGEVGGSGHVTGLDVNPKMLAVARAKEDPAALRVEWIEGDAQNLPFEDSSFEVVLCQQGLQFFPNPPGAIVEMFRVLESRGRIGISVWRGVEHNPYGRAVAEAVLEEIGQEAANETRSPFAEEIGLELEPWLKEAGFTGIAHEVVRLPMEEADLDTFVRADLMAYPKTGAQFSSWSKERQDALVQNILDRLEEYRVDSGWTIPFEAWVGIAFKE